VAILGASRIMLKDNSGYKQILQKEGLHLRRLFRGRFAQLQLTLTFKIFGSCSSSKPDKQKTTKRIPILLGFKAV
jgi:hypothetical protein